jgi:hypothetical protein
MNEPDQQEKPLDKESLQKLADNMQLQVASFTVTLPEPPNHTSEVPAFMQALLDSVTGVHLALRDAGCDVLGMKAVKFTPSMIDPSSGRGDLEIHVIRAKTPQPTLHGKN